jgi:hypothetical protein
MTVVARVCVRQSSALPVLRVQPPPRAQRLRDAGKQGPVVTDPVKCGRAEDDVGPAGAGQIGPGYDLCEPDMDARGSAADWHGRSAACSTSGRWQHLAMRQTVKQVAIRRPEAQPASMTRSCPVSGRRAAPAVPRWSEVWRPDDEPRHSTHGSC